MGIRTGLRNKVPLVFGKSLGTIYNRKSLKCQIVRGKVRVSFIIKRQALFVKYCAFKGNFIFTITKIDSMIVSL